MIVAPHITLPEATVLMKLAWLRAYLLASTGWMLCWPRLMAVSAALAAVAQSSSVRAIRAWIPRATLTQGRLTLPWKPWSCGEGASHPLYRYLYLHLLFQTLQHPSQDAFKADWNAPLPIQYEFHSFGNRFHTRLLSMPSSSTSELLRTL